MIASIAGNSVPSFGLATGVERALPDRIQDWHIFKIVSRLSLKTRTALHWLLPYR